MANAWRRFFAAHYIINVVVIASYALVREWVLHHSNLPQASIADESIFLPKELQAFKLLGITIAIKFLRRQSMDAWFADAFLFSKTIILFLSWFMGPIVFGSYIALFATLFVVLPAPLFSGLANMEYFTPGSFAELVEEREDSEVAWLVTFFAPWAPPCLYLEPVIAELSLQFTTPKLRFGKIDVSRWPNLAAKYNISTSVTGKQLPTLIMFEKGKEAGRIPHVYEDGRVAGGTFRKGDILTAFALSERWDKAYGNVDSAAKVVKGVKGSKKKEGSAKKKNK